MAFNLRETLHKVPFAMLGNEQAISWLWAPYLIEQDLTNAHENKLEPEFTNLFNHKSSFS